MIKWLDMAKEALKLLAEIRAELRIIREHLQVQAAPPPRDRAFGPSGSGVSQWGQR